MAKTEKVCFDRWLPSQLMRPHPRKMLNLGIGKTRAAFQISKLWPNGSVLKCSFLGGTPSQHNLVKQHAVQWSEFANLRLEFPASGSAQIRIAFADDGAWSYVGTDALGIPANQPTMNYGWLDEGVILHEFGHCIGLIHEHQNPITNPIQWNKPVVNAALSGPPNFWDQATIDHNLYAKYSVSQINGSDFDPKSVMLYSFPASWTTNGFHSEPNETVSAVDKQMAAQVYPKSAVGSEAVELAVHEATQADIGQPGEEDLFQFTTKNSGRYRIETEGFTDVVMKLYGPNQQLLGEDDDSGEGRNALIVSDLVTGTYQVQVRHYNSDGGTGQYGIKVIRV